MKTFTVRQVLKLLEREGWYVARPGTHRQLKHPDRSGPPVTVAGNLGDEIPTGTLRNIYKQAGLRWPPVSSKKK